MDRNRSDPRERDERLQAVLLEFIESADRGASPTPAALLARHPELAPELAEFLDTWVHVEGLTAPIRSASQARQEASHSGRLPATKGDEPRGADRPASAEPADAGEPGNDSICRPEKALGPESRWLERWLRKHQPLAAERYPFLSVSKGQEEIGRLGPYRLLEVIGSGGMGVVFRAEDVSLRRSVAVKVLRSELAADPGSRARFLREARSAAALDHENVIAVYHVGEHEGIPFLGMQWLQGMNLEELLRRVGTVEVRAVLRLGRQIATGLAAAHGRGLLHRDIKPANLWIEMPSPRSIPSGDQPDFAAEGRVKILDFGLARAADEEGQLTRSGAAIGTPAYMAPEQAAGAAVDARSDLFGLGVVLYRMCTGRHPFPGQRPAAGAATPAADLPPPVREINPAVPLGLSDLVMELLAHEPSCRPASAAEVADRLRALQGPETAPPAKVQPLAMSSGPTIPSSFGGRTWRGCAAAVAMTLAVLLPLWSQFGGTVVRFASNKGEVVIDVDDPDMDVIVKEGGAVIEDRKKQRRIALAAGDHELEVTVKDAGGESRVFTKSFALRRGGKEVINVREELLPLASAPAPDSAEVDRPGAEWVLALGGKVTLRAANRELEVPNARDLPAGAFRLIAVDLSGTEANDAGVERLGALAELRYLRLSRTCIGDRGLAYLSGLKSLHTLLLNQTRVSDAGLAHLRELTGLVSLELSSTMVGDVGLAHLEPLKKLYHLYLYDTRVSDAGLVHLRSLTSLHSLILASTKVTDAGLQHIRTLPELERLHLNNLQVTDAGLAHLEGLKKLRYLNLAGTRITDKGLDRLQGLTALQELALDYTRVSDAGLARVEALQNLQSLNLGNTQVTDVGVSRLRTLTNLQSLILPCTKVTDAGLPHLESLAALRDLDLNGTRVGDAGLASLTAFKKLRGISLAGTPVTDAGMVHLKEVKHLLGLDLTNTQVSDAGLAHLAGLTSLQNLRLSGTQVTDAGLGHLAGLTDLQYLHLAGARVTDAGMVRLGAMKQLREIYLTGTQVTEAGLAQLLSLPLPPLTVMDLSGSRVSASGAAAVKGILPHAQIEWWEPNRRTAEAIFVAGGSVHIRTAGRGSDFQVTDSAALPADYFRLTRAALQGVRKPPRELLLLLASLTDPKFDDLEEVDLSGSTVSDGDLESLGALPCRRLVLNRCPVVGTGLIHLKKLPRMTDLSLECSTMSFLGVRYVGELKRLERLSLAGSGATDASLKNLDELVKLRELDLSRTKVTADGVAALRTALPRCDIKVQPTGPR